MNGLDGRIVDITRAVWSCTLGLEARWLPEGGPSGDEVRGRVELRGDWSGALTLRCSAKLARRAAGLFFGRPEVSEAEARDAVGELANMTGGNLKALLRGSCVLSPPLAEIGPALPGIPRLAFACGDQVFTVEFAAEERP